MENSRISTALEVTLTGKLKWMQINDYGIHIGYYTQGSAFLNNDQEDITTGISLPLLNNRITMFSLLLDDAVA